VKIEEKEKGREKSSNKKQKLGGKKKFFDIFSL
jgi:hypothetical protein